MPGKHSITKQYAQLLIFSSLKALVGKGACHKSLTTWGEGGWKDREGRKGNSELGLLQDELKMGSFFSPGFRHGLLEWSKS